MKLYRVDYHTKIETTSKAAIVEADNAAHAKSKMAVIAMFQEQSQIVVENVGEIPVLVKNYNIWKF